MKQKCSWEQTQIILCNILYSLIRFAPDLQSLNLNDIIQIVDIDMQVSTNREKQLSIEEYVCYNKYQHTRKRELYISWLPTRLIKHSTLLPEEILKDRVFQNG